MSLPACLGHKKSVVYGWRGRAQATLTLLSLTCFIRAGPYLEPFFIALGKVNLSLLSTYCKDDLDRSLFSRYCVAGLDQCWACRDFGEAASVSVIKK